MAITCRGPRARDRKSTRLNASHPSISYAVFCLKKKKDELLRDPDVVIDQIAAELPEVDRRLVSRPEYRALMKESFVEAVRQGVCFFFNDTPTTEIYTLSLHDALPISLSLKDTLPDPWESVVQKYAIGSRVHGKVRNLTDFGAFVEIEEGVDGLVHVSDMSWSKRIKHPSEVLKKGDEVEAIITSIDEENRRISLSIKEFQPNDFQTFRERHQPGDVVEGTVSRVADFGVFVQIEGLVEGLMHVSETP